MPVVNHVPHRSGFSKRHHWLGTSKVGTITPVLIDEVIPGTPVYLNQASNFTMPPLASDAYMKLDLKFAAFFVPHRINCGGFESFFTQHEYPVIRTNYADPVTNVVSCMPALRLFGGNIIDDSSYFEPGSLLDYLGFKYNPNDVEPAYSDFFDISMMPLLAYHRVCNDWFRSPSIEKDYFARAAVSSYNQVPDSFLPAIMPYFSLVNDNFIFYCHDGEDGGRNYITDSERFLFADKHNLFDLRQANFGFDYFTRALPSAQLGQPVIVSVDEDYNGFTINQLRAMNSLQRFREVNQLAGDKFADVIKARYGADLSVGVAQRSLLLGSLSYDVYNKTVDVSGGNNNNNIPTEFSKFAGSQMGRAVAGGINQLIDGFVANEPGYILVVAWLSPRASYATGVNRLLRRYVGGTASITDMANPTFQNTGMQPVYSFELHGQSGFIAGNDNVFGYVDRFADWFDMNDEVHGLFVDGFNLSYMAPQRSFTGAPTIGHKFLQIPKNYLDGITTVNAALSNFGYWLDIEFDYSVSMPLNAYSIPSIENPAAEHGEAISVHTGGFRL